VKQKIENKRNLFKKNEEERRLLLHSLATEGKTKIWFSFMHQFVRQNV